MYLSSATKIKVKVSDAACQIFVSELTVDDFLPFFALLLYSIV